MKRETGIKGRGLARFMELRGRRIVEAAGAAWHSVEGRIYMSIPHQLVLDPEPEEIHAMLRSVKGAGVRFPSRNRGGLPSGLYVCRNKGYGILSVQPRLRTKIRRGLEQCEIRTVDSSELESQGLQLNLDTMSRQGRLDPEFADPARWKRLVTAVRNSPAISVKGAFVGGKLSAYTVLYREDGWVHILHQMSRQDALPHNSNHALAFHVTEAGLRDPGIEAVCYGLMSLVNTSGLHDYKLRLGYETVARNSSILLHPAISAVLACAPVACFVRGLRRLRPADQRLERVSAVIQGARQSGRTPEEAPQPASAWNRV